MNEAKITNLAVNFKDAFYLTLILSFTLATTAFVAAAQFHFTFNLGNLVPGLSAAAALNGLRKARNAYRAGRGLRQALKVAFSWNVVALLISAVGESAVAYLLENNIDTLANH